MPARSRKIGIWGNIDKPTFWKIFPEIVTWANENDVELFITTYIDIKSKKNFRFGLKRIESAEDFGKLDLLLSLGGDGTLLSLARAVGNRKTPILGIHLGELGFLAEVTLDNMFEKLNQFLDNKFDLQERMVLLCTVKTNMRKLKFIALNDITIDRGQSHRLVNFSVNANGNHVANYKADGLIVATPTGSTAYSLSAGGPIVMPSLDAMVITPICPHTLTLRPIVMPDDKTIQITFQENNSGGIGFAVDGQQFEILDLGDIVTIKRADHKVNMVIFSDTNYFNTLSRKMGWGKRGND